MQFWKNKYDPSEGARMNMRGMPKQEYVAYLSAWKEIKKKGISTHEYCSVLPASSVEGSQCDSQYPSRNGNSSQVSLESAISCTSGKFFCAASLESARVSDSDYKHVIKMQLKKRHLFSMFLSVYHQCLERFLEQQRYDCLSFME